MKHVIDLNDVVCLSPSPMGRRVARIVKWRGGNLEYYQSNGHEAADIFILVSNYANLEHLRAYDKKMAAKLPTFFR